MLFVPDAGDLYYMSEMMHSSMWPLRFNLKLIKQSLSNNPKQMHKMVSGGFFESFVEMTERLTRNYTKPSFDINSCIIEGKTVKITEQKVLCNTFCDLIHFTKPEFKKRLPKLLIVAPMSGHYATLLRNTVEETLPFFDVYITDWKNANQVPITHGSFDLDAFIDYVINFLKFLGGDVHVMAVCQPTVPVIAATATMCENKDACAPRSMILIGGPIDARKNPTVPGDFAIDKELEWFDSSLITTVPQNYPGYRRRVYPGFLQLAGFVMMNWQKHYDAHIEMFVNIATGNSQKAEKQKKFYDEYFSVMDLPAEFYLQTIREVFHEFSLAQGKFVSRGRKVNLCSIENTALMGIEGEKDDIAAIGQTKAALFLCKNIPESKKSYYLQNGAGHYGVFSGSKFKEFVVPKIKEFVYNNE